MIPTCIPPIHWTPTSTVTRRQILIRRKDKDGNEHERICDVAGSEGRYPAPDGSLPKVGNTVDLETGDYNNSIGAPALSALWTDPNFEEIQSVFYYVRVLQIPTPRHSLLDAIALQIEAPSEGPPTIQERAYTSPVWYVP